MYLRDYVMFYLLLEIHTRISSHVKLMTWYLATNYLFVFNKRLPLFCSILDRWLCGMHIWIQHSWYCHNPIWHALVFCNYYEILWLTSNNKHTDTATTNHCGFWLCACCLWEYIMYTQQIICSLFTPIGSKWCKQYIEGSYPS